MNTPSDTLLVHKTKHVHSFYRPGTSDWLLITFNPMTMRAHGNNFWGEPVARKNGISVLGIVSTEPNWFPDLDIREIREASDHIIRRYNDKVTYGMSMGGYGAIKYSGLFCAKTAISFSPQFSINPNVTKGRDERYARYYDPRKHTDMEAKKDDFKDTFVVLFYDPAHKQDAFCASEFDALGDVKLIPLHHMGHGTVGCFSGTEKVLSLFKNAKSHDIRAIRSEAHKFKSRHPNRLHSLACKALRHHPGVSFRIYSTHPELLTGARSSEFAKHCIRFGRIQEAISWTLSLVERETASDTLYRQLGTLKFAARDIEGGREALLRAFELSPDDHNARLMAQALLVAGEGAESLDWARKAHAINQRSAQNIIALIQALEHTGSLAEAANHADEGLKLHPQSGILRFIRERVGRAIEAMQKTS